MNDGDTIGEEIVPYFCCEKQNETPIITYKLMKLLNIQTRRVYKTNQHKIGEEHQKIKKTNGFNSNQV